jgi:hypothetical protein
VTAGWVIDDGISVWVWWGWEAEMGPDFEVGIVALLLDGCGDGRMGFRMFGIR